jgi:hypothetical protein
MSDQLAEEGPAGRNADGVAAGVTPVAEAAWNGQPQQPLLISLDGGRSGKRRSYLSAAAS